MRNNSSNTKSVPQLPMEVLVMILLYLKKLGIRSDYLLGISNGISKILTQAWMHYVAHISSNEKSSTSLSFQEYRKYLNDPLSTQKYLRFHQSQKTYIPKDFPICVLIISSFESLKIYEAMDLSKIHTLILSPENKDEKFYINVMSQLQNSLLCDESSNSKTIVLHNLNINVRLFTFKQLHLNRLLMSNCTLKYKCFPICGSIEKLDMFKMKLFGMIELFNYEDSLINAKRVGSIPVKACHITISEMDSLSGPCSISPPGIVFDSDQLKSLAVCYAPGYRQRNFEKFQVGLPFPTCLENLNLEMNDSIILFAPNPECFSKLINYCGDDPSKVIFRHHSDLKNHPIMEYRLKSKLSLRTKVHTQKKTGNTQKESCSIS